MAYCDASDPLLLLKIAECVSRECAMLGLPPAGRWAVRYGAVLTTLMLPLQFADGLGAVLLLGDTAPAWYTSMAFGGLLLTRTVAITIHAARRSTRLTVSRPRRRHTYKTIGPGFDPHSPPTIFSPRTCCSWAAAWCSTWWWPSC